MARKLIVAATLVGAAALAFATSARAAGGAALHITTGGATEITLTENPSTGYVWRIDDAASRGLGSVVAIEDSGYRPGAAMPGAPGTHRWMLRGVKPGKAVVAFVYARVWEKTVGQARQFAVEVTP